MKKLKSFVVLATLLLAVTVFAQQAFPPITLTLQSVQSSGNGTEMSVKGYSVVTLEIVGNEAGTDRVVTFEAWQDVTAGFVAVQCANQGTRVVGTTLTTSGVTAFHIQCDVAGFNRFRTPLSGGATGSVTVTATAISNSSAGIVTAVTTPASGVIGDVNVEQWNNQTVAVPFDLDTGAGTQNIVGFSIRKAASGGSVEYGTATDPIRNDPTGTTTQPVSGPLTDAQLRATAVPVSGPLTDTQLRATAVPVSGPLTDTQLRATSVPISGTVTANAGTNLNTSALALEATLASIKDTAGIKKITDALPAGTNLMGKAGIDQTTLATTNGVTLVPTSNATAANSLTSSSAAQASNVLKASAGNLYSLTITTGATAGFLMVFNATSAPIDGAVTPAYCSQAPANMTSALEWSIPVRFGTGITVVFSSTGCFTKTESATAAFFAQVN